MIDSCEPASGRHAQRDRRIDALKGFTIILVVIGHAFLAGSAASAGGDTLLVGGVSVARGMALSLSVNIIYTFHMPLFAFLSGFVLFGREGGSAGKLLSKRALTLLVPYLCWLVILAAVNAAATHGDLGAAFRLLTSGVIGNTATPGPLWFLYALFECFGIFWAVRSLTRSRWALAGSALLAIALAQVPAIANAPVLFASSVLAIYPGFILGYLVASEPGWFARRNAIVAVLSSAGFALALYLTFPIFFPQMSPMAHIIALLPTLPAGLVRKAIVLATLSLNLVARSGVSLAGCLCVYSLSRYVPEPVLRPFEYVGAQTLGIYAVNGIVLLGLVTLGLTQPQLLFAATLALSLGATLLIRRIPVASDYLLGTLRRPPRSST